LFCTVYTHNTILLTFSDMFVKLGALFRYFASSHGSIFQKVSLLFHMRRNVNGIQSATSLMEQLAIVTAVLNLEVPGVVVECGSFKGASATNLSLACRLANRELWVCDSFEGLPEPKEYDRIHRCPGWNDVYERGQYCGTFEEVRENIRRFGDLNRCHFLKGYFSNTLPNFRHQIALAFCDVDLVDSLRDCLTYLWPQMENGAIFFTHEARDEAIISLFRDPELWDNAPGLIGGGTGLPLHKTPEGLRSNLGYTVKRDSHVRPYSQSSARG
jgi:O-methyltransferase